MRGLLALTPASQPRLTITSRIPGAIRPLARIGTSVVPNIRRGSATGRRSASASCGPPQWRCRPFAPCSPPDAGPLDDGAISAAGGLPSHNRSAGSASPCQASAASRGVMFVRRAGRRCPCPRIAAAEPRLAVVMIPRCSASSRSRDRHRPWGLAARRRATRPRRLARQSSARRSELGAAARCRSRDARAPASARHGVSRHDLRTARPVAAEVITQLPLPCVAPATTARRRPSASQRSAAGGREPAILLSSRHERRHCRSGRSIAPVRCW